MRHERTDLERTVSKAMIDAVLATTPGLRDSIRDALNKGANPKQVRAQWGHNAKRTTGRQVALAVEWIVDEWERDTGRVKQHESIDHVQ